MPRPFVPQAVPGVEARAGTFPGPSLIPLLNELQAKLGWLPREELVALAREAGRPLYEIQGLISFYPHYRTEPPVPVSIGVTACARTSRFRASTRQRSEPSLKPALTTFARLGRDSALATPSTFFMRHSKASMASMTR